MIETKEQYESYLIRIRKPLRGEWEETIEALREVTRKPDEWFDPDGWVLDEGPICLWCYSTKTKGHRPDCIYDALPDWLTDD
jgi:hypothetical protein